MPSDADAPTHAPVRIALLQSADAPAYKVLRDASLLRTPEAFSTDYATAVTRPPAIYSARFSRPGDGPFYLGAFTEQGRLVGSIGFDREEARFKRHIGHINAVMIDVNFEHQGIARQLLEACIAHAEQIAGLEILQLGVTASSERAVRLYQRAGFRSYGRLPRAVVIDGIGHDHLLMLRPLAACPALN
ncbi:GNAT family N-acetyltransferase [Diaphorobacter aerolatus]|uniref:GNAT family N-acetyltransferase n=1 Tax=Diaphorobacter aerolatus TaxID=1288495 RepID=A0A7H0GLM2_9BURK|nr:GNAT family protein [Diaphorobacter aerolatus]QNP49188.1 GNAT family N-acetyltransferase [Diaphorobacter aerolatus]